MRKTGNDYSTMLIWAAALVGVVRYAAAFLASDMGEISGTLSMVISIAMGFTGLGMGVLDTVGAAYLFDGWRRAMPKSGQPWPFRFRVLTVFVAAIFGTGLGILVPFTVARVAHQTMAMTLGPAGIWLWGLAVNLAPVLLIGGVAVGQNVVKVSEGAQVTGQMTGQLTGGENLSGQLSGQMQTYPADWRQARKVLTANQVRELAGMATGDICYKYGLTDRQARRWREHAQQEKAEVEE